jgi:hypothetical protein
MTNALFMYENLVDVGSVYPTSEDSLLPATNIQHRFRTKVWEVNSPVADLVIDFGSERAFTHVALCNYDWPAEPNSLYLEFGTSSFSAASGQTQELNWVPNPSDQGNRVAIVKTFTLNSAYQFARLRVHVDSIWQLGRMSMGEHFEPALNILHSGFRKAFEDDSHVSQSVGGQEHVDEIERFRSINMRFVARTQGQIDEFMKMWNHSGSRKDFFLALDYDNEPNEDTLYGKFDRDMRISRPSPFRWDVTLSFHEVR